MPEDRDKELIIETRADVKHIRAVLDETREKFNGVDRRFVGLDEKYDQRYVSRHEFTPVQKVVYGIVGASLVAVIGGLLALVIK